MKDKKTYNMELQTGEKTSHKAVSPYWFAFIPAAAFAILTMYVGISENMASGAILFVSVVIVFLMIFVPISLIIFILRKIISAIRRMGIISTSSIRVVTVMSKARFFFQYE